MSYATTYSPVLCSEIKSPIEDSSRLRLSDRKVIARRASRVLKPGQTVNLGIGLPEGVASVAGEEGLLPYITLTTEPGKQYAAFILFTATSIFSPRLPREQDRLEVW